MANERFESVGDAVEVDPALFHVTKPKYKLADLLASVTVENKHSATDWVSLSVMRC